MLKPCTGALFSLLFLSLATPAQGKEMPECLERYLVMDQAIRYDFQEKTKIKANLPTQNSHGFYYTPAAFHFQASQNARVFFSFVTPQMWIPYNIYSLEFTIGEEGDADFFHFEEDFTQNCTGPGRSLVPRDVLYLPEIKIPAPPDGAPRGVEKLHIRIWGHL